MRVAARARARAVAAALGVLVALASASVRADPIISGLPGRVGQEVRAEVLGQNVPQSADVYDYGNLTRSFMIYVLGKPFLFSEEDVDRIIGDPYHMNESTRLKLDALPPRMRLKLYSVASDRADRIYLRGVNRLGQVTPGDFRSVAVDLDFETANRLIDAIGKSIDGYFRIEELIDLTVYGLSKYEFFPKTHERWNELKLQLPKYDLALGIIALTALAVVDEGNLDMGGWLLKTPTDSFRFGWYASARKFGFKWHPRITLGLQGATPGFDTSLGWTEYFNPIKAQHPWETNDSRTLQWTVREHLFTRWTQEHNWETSGMATLSFVWLNLDPLYNETFRGEVAFYARRPAIIETPQVDFLLEGGLSSDFRHQHLSNLAVGFELPVQSIAGALHFYSLTDPVLPTEWRAGVMFGGSIGESDDTDYYRNIEELGRQMRMSIRWVQQVEERWCYFEAQAREAGPQDKQAEARLKTATTWLEQALQHLKKRSERYTREKGRLAKKTRQLVGPLTPEEMDAYALLPGPVTEAELGFVKERVAMGPACRAGVSAEQLGVEE
ncbi:MAG: hypothetical protein QM765_52410 [Myxococcales bacterium]